MPVQLFELFHVINVRHLRSQLTVGTSWEGLTPHGGSNGHELSPGVLVH
jgi:hypothetical protein